MAAFLVPFTSSSINLALPEIAKHFSLNAVTLTWISTAYLITTAMLQIPFAKIADLFGRKRIFILGVSIFSVGSVLCGFSTSGTALILFRIVSGIGSAMLFCTNIAILISIFPPEKRGKVLGINAVIIYLSLALGPFLGGIFTQHLGWHSIFFFCGFIGLIVIGLSFFFLHGEWAEAKGEKFDWIGSFIYGFSIFGIIFGFSKLPSTVGFICLFAGITGLFLFAFQENRCKYPVFNLKAFKENKVFLFSSLATLINYSATFAIGFMISLYLQYIRGFSPRIAGFILITQAVVQTVFSYFSGKYSDRISPFKLATCGMLLIVCGIIGLIFLTPEIPIIFLIGLLVLLGCGFGLFASPNMNIIMSSVEKKQYGQASAVNGTARLVGQSLSMGIAGMAIFSQIGNQKISPTVHTQLMNSIHITFIIFLFLCLLALYSSTVRGKKQGKSSLQNPS
jgi:EmrB/QacA subfamily drug resistance transporter